MGPCNQMGWQDHLQGCQMIQMEMLELEMQIRLQEWIGGQTKLQHLQHKDIDVRKCDFKVHDTFLLVLVEELF